MASIIPDWLHGWNTTTFTIRYQVADATGLLGDGASTLKTLTGVIDGVEVDNKDTAVDISALTSRTENSVAVATDVQMRVMEIASNNITLGNFLPFVFRNASFHAGGDYALFSFVRGANTITFTGTMGELSSSVGPGKNTHSLTLAIADIYTDVADPAPDTPATNPVFA